MVAAVWALLVATVYKKMLLWAHEHQKVSKKESEKKKSLGSNYQK